MRSLYLPYIKQFGLPVSVCCAVYTFLISSSLICQFLSVAQFIPSLYQAVWSASFCLLPSLYLPYIKQFGLPVSVCCAVYTFLISSSLVCQFLSVAQFMQTTTKRVFLWYRSQRCAHLLCRFRMMFTCTKHVEKISYHDWLPVSVSCQDYTNDHRVSSFAIGLKGMYISSVGLQ